MSGVVLAIDQGTSATKAVVSTLAFVLAMSVAVPDFVMSKAVMKISVPAADAELIAFTVGRSLDGVAPVMYTKPL